MWNDISCGQGDDTSQKVGNAHAGGGNQVDRMRNRSMSDAAVLPTRQQCSPENSAVDMEAPSSSIAADALPDAIVNAVCMHLRACSQVLNVNAQKDMAGKYPILISADLQNGPVAAHDVMHLIRRILTDMSTRVPTVALLGTRLQKEESGYSLRASVAGVPKCQEHNMCWDLFQKGRCYRRGQCRWYHPCDCDIVKLKVSIRHMAENCRPVGPTTLV